MLAGRLARNRFFHRLSFPSSSQRTVSETCAFYASRVAQTRDTSRFWRGGASSSSLKGKKSKTTMAGASAAGVSPEEIEALRKQVEDLKVRTLYIVNVEYIGWLDVCRTCLKCLLVVPC